MGFFVRFHSVLPLTVDIDVKYLDICRLFYDFVTILINGRSFNVFDQQFASLWKLCFSSNWPLIWCFISCHLLQPWLINLADRWVRRSRCVRKAENCYHVLLQYWARYWVNYLNAVSESNLCKHAPHMIEPYAACNVVNSGLMAHDRFFFLFLSKTVTRRSEEVFLEETFVWNWISWSIIGST